MSKQLTFTSDAEKMAALTKGTTKEQWERYYEELARFNEHCERQRPVPPPDYFTGEEKDEAERYYRRLYSQWEMMCSCDAPNKPGYYRANND